MGGNKQNAIKTIAISNFIHIFALGTIFIMDISVKLITNKQQDDIREGMKDLEKGNTIRIKNINNIWESIL